MGFRAGKRGRVREIPHDTPSTSIGVDARAPKLLLLSSFASHGPRHPFNQVVWFGGGGKRVVPGSGGGEEETQVPSRPLGKIRSMHRIAAAVIVRISDERK